MTRGQLKGGRIAAPSDHTPAPRVLPFPGIKSTWFVLLVPPKVAVTLPDVRGRQEILDLYLAGKPVAPDVDTGAREAAAAGGLGGEPGGRYACTNVG